MTIARHLPARRLHESDHTLTFEDVSFHIGLGRPANEPNFVEVFIRPAGRFGKSSQFERICDDVGVLISHMLRAGVRADQLGLALGRDGGVPGVADSGVAKPSSFVGAVVDLIAARQRELDEQGEPLL